MKSGNDKQRRAYDVIQELGILNDMRNYDPVLCGTIPIAIDVLDSDLDIIMEVHDLEAFKAEAAELYGKHEAFAVKEKIIRNIPAVKANFKFGGFEFECFGQPLDVEQQNAYRHMINEYHLLQAYPHLRSEIIRLKEQGMKTEPAFAQVFGLEGDPYDELLAVGPDIIARKQAGIGKFNQIEN